MAKGDGEKCSIILANFRSTDIFLITMRFHYLFIPHLLITCSLLLITSISFSQENKQSFRISGLVISARTGKPIPDAAVMFTESTGIVCDSNGYFKIFDLHPGIHKLKFTAWGYPEKDTVLSVSDTDIHDLIWRIETDCREYNREQALKDIKEKKPAVLFQSGGAVTANSNDISFQKKYKVFFQDFGCIAGDWNECMIEYNKTIFNYLDKTYGKKWRREIRNDAIGFTDK
jgi:hypothetical protein